MHAELPQRSATAGRLARHDAASLAWGAIRSGVRSRRCVPASVPCHRPAARRSASTAPCERRSVCEAHASVPYKDVNPMAGSAPLAAYSGAGLCCPLLAESLPQKRVSLLGFEF